MRLFYFFAATAVAALIFSQAQPLYADSNVSMNVIAKNTTDEPQEKVVIRQDLPREIKKEDIIDAGGMAVRYDEEKGIYYLYAEENLQPQSAKSYTAILRDIWRIQDNDFDFLKEQTDQRLGGLKGKETYAAGEIFSKKIISQIEDVKAAQQTQTGDVEKRMDFYRTNTQRLSEIRQKVSVLDDFVKEAQRYEQTQKESKFITFSIETKNPSDTEPAEKVEVTRYLPHGMQPDQIKDAQGFEVKYDPEKHLYYLSNILDFKAGEIKKFEIIISDIWFIPDVKLDELQNTDPLTVKLANTGYEKLGAYLALEVKRYVAEIKETQKKAETPEDKVATYSENLKKMELINQDIEQLKRLVEAAEKIKQKKVSEIIKAITPDVATTWRLIYATIGFLVVVASSFYFLWWGQIKAKQNQKVDIITTTKKDN